MALLVLAAIRLPSSQAQTTTRIESDMGMMSFENVILAILVVLLLFQGLVPKLIRLGLRVYYYRHKARTRIYVPYLTQISSPDPPRLTAMELRNELADHAPITYTVNKVRPRKSEPDLKGE